MTREREPEFLKMLAGLGLSLDILLPILDEEFDKLTGSNNERECIISIQSDLNVHIICNVLKKYLEIISK